MGGGRSNTVTQTSGVPEWLKPDVQKAFGAATRAYESGDLSRRAGHSPAQRQFLEQTAGEGLAGANQRQLSNFYGNQLAGQAGRGTLGSARADRARESALADASAKLAADDLQAKNQAFQQIQQDEQATADLPHQGLQRLFGYYGSGAAGTQQTQSGGGGK